MAAISKGNAPATPTIAKATPQVQPASAAVQQVPKVAVPAFQMSGLTEYDRWIKALLYGDYGTGKTRLAGSAVLVPSMRDIFVIDAEAGDLTIATEPVFQAFHDNFTVVKVRDFKTYARVQEFLKLHCFYRDQNTPEADAKLKELEQKLMAADQYDPDMPPKKFYTCITDSLSEVESYSMYQLLGITDKARIDEAVANPEWGEFRQNLSQVLRAIRAYRDLPMHVIFTCAAGYVQDEQKRQLWAPALTGKLSRQCQGFMDIVGYMYVTNSGPEGKKVHNIQVQPTAKINAKCRFSNFKGMGWQDPTIETIMAAVGLLDSKLLAGKKHVDPAPIMEPAPTIAAPAKA